MLINNGWPQSDAPSHDLSDILKYLEHTKREIRLALDKANTSGGGKKKGKGGGKNAAQAAPDAPKDSCVIAIGRTYPEF